MIYQQELEQSLDYLQSDRALRAVEADAYWPKWDSPWWHMLLLHEMGETKSIPERVINAHIASFNRIPLKIFPIHPGDMPSGNPYRDNPCHCQLGNVYQVLAAWGVDVDKELPWIRPWLLRYQMADGGLNCDNEAYLVKDETPSSMVGTIAAFEAILLYTFRPWTEEERIFLEKGSQFLIGRKLMLGSPTKHNAAERESAKDWLKPCFPRFYLYDVLRGLCALLLWGEKTGEAIPNEAVRDVITYLEGRFPDGIVRNERLSYEGKKTFLPPSSGVGEWARGEPATLFPLLRKVSTVGESSPFLTKHWKRAKVRLESLNRRRLEMEDIHFKLVKGDPQEITDLQKILESAPAFAHRTTGAPPGTSDAQSAFTTLPPNKTCADKFVFNVYRKGTSIGCVDLVRGYPDEATAWIGLLLIDERLHGQGLGRLSYQKTEQQIRSWPEIKHIRISVVATNDIAIPFWEKMGFSLTGERKPYRHGTVESEVILMGKTL